MLKVGYRVKKIKGYQSGVVGTIIRVMKASRLPAPNDLPLEDEFLVKADDGSYLSGFEDELEKVE